MDVLEQEIKELIVEALDLEDVTPAEIDASAPLFGDGLGLDSIDALELGLVLEKTYGVSLSEDTEENRRHFANVRSLAALVQTQRGS